MVATDPMDEMFVALKSHSGVAVVTDTEAISYGALSSRVERTAEWLQTRAPLGSIVALVGTSSWQMVADFWGVIRAGRVALPLDATWSAEWRSHVLRDAHPAVILDSSVDNPDDASRNGEIGVDVSPSVAARDRLAPDAAYVIYTSGSTGLPKGVVNSRRGLSNLFFAVRELFSLSSSDTVLQFASPSFDAWIWEICLSFSSGAALAIAGPDDRLHGGGLERLLLKRQVTVATLPPSVLQHASSQGLTRLHTIIAAGERCPPEVVRAWSTGRRFYNAYGPSEAAVCATVHLVDPQREAPTIGRPIPGVEAWIEDSNGRPALLGEPGQIVIGGAGVGMGYLNQPELTASRFSGNPAVFRTGDLGAIDAEGNLEFLGRIDHQVKVRGIRIELDCVERVLEEVRGARRVIAGVEREGTSQASLVAFVVPAPGAPIEALRRALIDHSRGRFQAKVVPRIVFVEDLPLTANGKVDRPALLAAMPPVPPPAAGRTLEATIGEYFRSHLRLTRVDPTDDFFLLGGDSLSFSECLMGIEAHLGRRVPVGIMARHSTPTTLAVAIERHARAEVDPDDPPVTSGDLDLSFLPPRSGPRGDGVFVTGGTGYLGAHVLRDLLERDEARVHCLVRAADRRTAEMRVRSNLKRHGFWKESYRSRLVGVPGELSKPRFGLSTTEYDTLARGVGFVYHLAAEMDWVRRYSDLTAINVEGTRHVLHLCHDAAATLGHVSSIGVLFSADWRARSLLDEDGLPEQGDHELGYLRSKWAGEQLVRSATRLGLRGYVFRPPFICGGASTSEPQSAQDFLYQMIHRCLDLGFAPTDGFHLNLYPADLLASTIVTTTSADTSQQLTYNFTNPRPLSWREFPREVEAHGFNVRPVEYGAWIDRVLQDPGGLAPFLPFLTHRDGRRGSAYEHYQGDWPAIATRDQRATPATAAELLTRYLPRRSPLRDTPTPR